MGDEQTRPGAVRAHVRDITWYRENVSCMTACPVRTVAGKYVQLIAEGQDEQAYLVARSPNPLASVCGRVCAAPCEDACRRGKVDQPITIRALKRFVTERYGAESERPETMDQLFQGRKDVGTQRPWSLPAQARRGRHAPKRRVAVIGGGPAGIACAHDLAVMGYPVTLFEGSDRLGGMMIHGVPEYRLPRQIIEREMEALTALGVEIRFRTPLTKEFGLKSLKAGGFEAVFIGIGAWKGRDLKIEGSNLDGIIKAVDYLLNVNQGYRVNLGERVLVIGGGSVALDAARTALVQDAMTGVSTEPTDEELSSPMKTTLDAARTALRKGARSVRVASLEAMHEMPAAKTIQGKEELEEAVAEGVELHPSRGPKEFVGKDGRVSRVVLRHVKRVFDDAGRFNPEFIPDAEETMEVDSVILAVGQGVDLDFLTREDGIALTRAGTVTVDPQTMATSAPGVFAGGDAAFGPKIIIDAEWTGKRAAASIDAYLRGVSPSATTINVAIEELETRTYRMPGGYEKVERRSPELIQIERRTGINELEQVYTEEQARAQAARCLVCHVETIYDAAKCVLCNRCVDVCPVSVLRIVPIEDFELDNSTVDDLIAQQGLDRTKPMAAMLKDDDRCIRCGLCAVRCPTGAFTMERFSYEESIAP